MSRLEKIRNNIFDKGNSYGVNSELNDDNQIHEVILHRGCTSHYRQEYLIESVSECLKKKNVDFSFLSDESCCGLMLFDLGDAESGNKVVDRNVYKFNKHGVKKIITICPGCYESFTKYYEKHPDFNIEIIFALDLFEDVEVNGEGYIIQDPCHALDRMEQVRSIVKNVPEKRANSCCGFGIGIKTGDKDKALQASKDTLENDKVITYCPSCYHTLSKVDESKTTDIFTLINNEL